MTDRVTPCLWFNDNAEEAVDFYVSLLPGSRIVSVSRYGDADPSKRDAVLTIGFELAGRRYLALNGGMDFPFSEAVSLIVACDSQAEIDRLWDRIGEGGTPQQCGWIKDRFGLPWQIVPSAIDRWISGDPAAAGRVMRALFGMVKLDMAALERAHEGEDAHA